MHIDQILQQVESHGTQYVCVTGGEPLAQRRCLQLLDRLCDTGYQVSLETSGAIDVSKVDERVSRVVDIKTPDSGEVDRNLWVNLEILTEHDQVKFVICSRGDYDWAVNEIRSRGLEQKLDILFSPVWGQVDATELATWVLHDQLNVRMQLQLHKILWGDEPGK
jgi:7-carboxy-7-deazaguanine synthase